jgi:peptide/nickel transport system substrate-binding protein
MVFVLRSLGYSARLRTVGPHAYYDTIFDARIRAQAGYDSWFAGYPSAAEFIPTQLSCQPINLSRFCDHSIDRQMARAAAVQVQDPAAATVLWQRVEQSLLAQAPVVPTYNRRNVEFVSKRLGNYQYNPQWGFLVDQAWVK